MINQPRNPGRGFPRQWAGIPMPTQGQQHTWATAHRLDMIGPIQVPIADYGGPVHLPSGVDFMLPGSCILLEILAASEDAGEIDFIIGAAYWGPITMPGGIPGVLGLGRYPATDELALVLTDPAGVTIDYTDVDLAYVWFHVARWAGTP